MKIMIILGVWVLNINVLNNIVGNVKKRLFCFLWINKREKVKREGIY